LNYIKSYICLEGEEEGSAGHSWPDSCYSNAFISFSFSAY